MKVVLTRHHYVGDVALASCGVASCLSCTDREVVWGSVLITVL